MGCFTNGNVLKMPIWFRHHWPKNLQKKCDLPTIHQTLSWWYVMCYLPTWQCCFGWRYLQIMRTRNPNYWSKKLHTNSMQDIWNQGRWQVRMPRLHNETKKWWMQTIILPL
jgi:hypothetical protein